MARYQSPRPPLRFCPACGRRFASWREGSYCGRADCRRRRVGRPAAISAEPGGSRQVADPGPAGPPYGELPEGF